MVLERGADADLPPSVMRRRRTVVRQGSIAD
jgi:hypothetical protein